MGQYGQYAIGGLQLASMMFGGNASGASTFTNSEPAFNMAQGMQRENLALQQGMYNEQAQTAIDEAAAEAMRIAEQAKTFRENQAFTYSSGGILLEGTPMKVLNHTVTEAQKQVAAVQKRGAAMAKLYRAQGQVLMNEGSAQLLGSSMNFQAQKAQAAMAEAANQSANWQSILSGLGGMFSSSASRRPTTAAPGAGAYANDPYAPGGPASW